MVLQNPPIIYTHPVHTCTYISSIETWSLALREETRLRVLENSVLRRTFGPERDEVTGEWRRLRNEELYDLYCSPHVIRVINSRIMRYLGHAHEWGRGDVCTAVLWGDLRERGHLEDSGDGRVILSWICRKSNGGGAWTGLIWLIIGSGGRYL